MNIKLPLIIFATLSLLILSACMTAPISQPSPTETLAPENLRLLTVTGVTINRGIGSPGLLEIVADVNWPDLCAQLAQVTSHIDGMDIQVSLKATAADPTCPPDALGGIPFRINIPLNPAGLPMGTYTVTVNSVTISFDWQP